MSSRTHILEAVRRNQPASVPLPEVPTFEAPSLDAPSFDAPGGGLVEAFAQVVAAVGGHIVAIEADVDDADAPGTVAAALAAAYPDVERVASTVEGVPGTVALGGVDDPHALADLQLFVCRGTLGVAENGAVWVPEANLGHRAAPFLAEHLALVLDRRDLVANLHAAYARLRTDAEAFGVFISGPSKTADIEQALVIGAHGPRSLTVLLTR